MPTSHPTRFNATLVTARGFCRATVIQANGQKMIYDTSAITCVLAGTPAFDAWFRARYPVDDGDIRVDGCITYRLRLRRLGRPEEDAA